MIDARIIVRGLLPLRRRISICELYRGIMFNTGDLGRMLPDGSLEHFGRVDDQVKIKVSRTGHASRV